MTIYKKYNNGLRLILNKMQGMVSTSIGVMVKTGSINESQEENGISHFIEHVLFKGTSKRTAFEISDYIDRIGAQINAFTSKELTCYYTKSTGEHMGDALEVLGKETKNLTVDFSANVSDEALRRCIEAFGIERVMFGTDLPVSKMKMYRISENGNYINVIPRGLYGDVSNDPHMRETDEKNITNFTYEIVRSFKRVAKDLTLTKKDVEDIMCNNAANLYGIKF
jgi:hypothetical protein